MILNLFKIQLNKKRNKDLQEGEIQQEKYFKKHFLGVLKT